MISDKKKITYTLYVNPEASPDQIEKKLISKKVKVDAMIKGEVMAQWARDLGISRQAVYQVVDGYRKNPRVRKFIEERLCQKFW